MCKVIRVGQAAKFGDLRNRHDAIRTLLEALLAHVLPRDCALCNVPTGGAHLCSDCVAALRGSIADPASCPQCALPSPAGVTCGSCLKQPFTFDRTIALWSYQYPIDRLIQALKYHAKLPLADFFAETLACAVSDTKVDLVLAVPLARARLRSRGFNQSVEIARRVARRIGVPIALDAVTRSRSSRPQAELPLAARHRNVRGVFTAQPILLGSRVAIVDDVMTSGATLDAVAQAAKRAGAIYVENWVVARAQLRR